MAVHDWNPYFEKITLKIFIYNMQHILSYAEILRMFSLMIWPNFVIKKIQKKAGRGPAKTIVHSLKIWRKFQDFRLRIATVKVFYVQRGFFSVIILFKRVPWYVGLMSLTQRCYHSARCSWWSRHLQTDVRHLSQLRLTHSKLTSINQQKANRNCRET